VVIKEEIIKETGQSVKMQWLSCGNITKCKKSIQLMFGPTLRSDLG
jgi:hypothetical protein